MSLKEYLKQSRPLILDGAMGTMLFIKLPSYKGCFELLNIERPDVIQEIHQAYIKAGANIIETNSFGGNKLKLAEYGLSEQCFEINRAAAEVARKAAASQPDVFVGGSVGPTGHLIEPVGSTSCETVINAFKEQIRGLAQGGADCIIIETMNDIQEARLALIAAKSVCDLPVICSMTFEKDGKTISGTDMSVAFYTLAQSGASMVGTNCSMGPERLYDLLNERKEELSKLGKPLCVWANAGLPIVKDGITTYPMAPKEFANISKKFFELGIQMVGGCCGTSPDHVSELAKFKSSFQKKISIKNQEFTRATSRTSMLKFDGFNFPLLIGERLNPTARKAFAADLKEGKWGFLREHSRLQISEGAHFLDINVGLPSIDEKSAMRSGVSLLTGLVQSPLVLDSDNAEVLESGLLVYPGIPIINSVNGTKVSKEQVSPLLQRFGSFVIALCLDDTGIHREASRRIKIGENLINELGKAGISSDRVLIDPLMLAESAEPGSAMETLKVIEHFSKTGIKTSIGLSNISFGLPLRKHINNAFMKMAALKGLTAAIVNPTAIERDTVLTEEQNIAASFLKGDDPGARKYIRHFGSSIPEPKKIKPAEKKTSINDLYQMVVDGNDEDMESVLDIVLKTHSPQQIMDSALLAGLEQVGELYSSGEYFLPQMIASANAMKKGFRHLRPLLAGDSDKIPATILICTVKGDIHDIGKNIVAMMLENHGFTVLDLGKDVSAEDIIQKAKENSASLVCLSSLLTTTMGEMKKVKKMMNDEMPEVPLMIGGAVVTQEYADEIGAYYGGDAVQGVEIAKQILGHV